VIGISGATRCGKGTLTSNLVNRIKEEGFKIGSVHQDNYDSNYTLVQYDGPHEKWAEYEYTDSINF
jgi:uridine kinase